MIGKSPRNSLNYTSTPPVNAHTSVSDHIRVLEGFYLKGPDYTQKVKLQSRLYFLGSLMYFRGILMI